MIFPPCGLSRKKVTFSVPATVAGEKTATVGIAGFQDADGAVPVRVLCRPALRGRLQFIRPLLSFQAAIGKKTRVRPKGLRHDEAAVRFPASPGRR